MFEHDLVSDGETQSTAAGSFAARRLESVKWPEDGLDLSGGNPRATVAYLDRDLLLRAIEADVDGLVASVLHCIL